MFNNKPKKNEVYFGYIDDKVAYLRVQELSYTKRDNYVVHGTIIIPFQKQNEILKSIKESSKLLNTAINFVPMKINYNGLLYAR